ncbi:MAG: hypothetical protein H7Y37_12090 [Anaerolineae bacterium]|nr:hypothetical protein [Gloeobacterales cyanobacterium ES-bin-313]
MLSTNRCFVLLGIAATAVVCTSPAASAQTGLLFTPIAPCRIVDTRNAGGTLTSGVPRTITVNSGGPTANYSSQGGTSSGCGIPTDAKSVFFNFVVVAPSTIGDLQAWPVGTTIPAASISNFANLPGFNIANGIAVPVCTTSCATGDLNVQLNNASAWLVVDVVGYFK